VALVVPFLLVKAIVSDSDSDRATRSHQTPAQTLARSREGNFNVVKLFLLLLGEQFRGRMGTTGVP
jgi:hypothetical protein